MAAGPTLGLIGLGLLGSAMAERFKAAGFDVVGFDLNADRRREFEASGGKLAASPRDVAEACRRVVLSLPDANVSQTVVDQVLPALKPGDVIIDTTTGDPEQMQAIAEAAAQAGVFYLDATVGGSSRQARDGDVMVMVGGDADTCESCRDVFDAFAHQVFYVGPSGSGARTKLVLNLVLGLNRAVLAEGLAFGRSIGLDPAVTLEILQAGPAASAAMQTKGAKMIAEDFETQARLSQHLKDVRLILTAGGRSGAKLPFSELHRQLLESLEQAGYGDADNSAVIKAFDL